MEELLVHIDGIPIRALPGETVLEVASRSGIWIPHLCPGSHGHEPLAACRLCFVEVEGKPRPVTSCTEKVVQGMSLRTDTEAVRRLQRSALALVLSAHRLDCGRCFANGHCALQELGKRLGVKLKVRGLRDLSLPSTLDRTLGTVIYDRSKCVLCGGCVSWAKANGSGVFQFAARGLQTRIALFSNGTDPSVLESCWEVCPVGALFPASWEGHGHQEPSSPAETDA
ncbi:MAG: 2Fe-2S iron-sulfur cluster-binding protein [Thermodesulfobacteriota bacterium]